MSHSIDDLDTYEVYHETIRKAAKSHACDACKETIPKGHRYARIFIMFEGEPEPVVRCMRCQLIHEHLRMLAPGEMWPDERLNCGEEYERHWGHPPPEDIAALAFATPDELQARAAKGAA